MVETMHVLESKILIGIDISLGLAITNIVSLDSQLVSFGIVQTMYMGILDTRLGLANRNSVRWTLSPCL